MKSSKAKHVADRVELLDLGKPILGYPLGSQGVAWEEDLFGDFALLGTDMYAHKIRVVHARKKRHAHRRVAGHSKKRGVKAPDLAYLGLSLTLNPCLFYRAFPSHEVFYAKDLRSRFNTPDRVGRKSFALKTKIKTNKDGETCQRFNS